MSPENSKDPASEAQACQKRLAEAAAPLREAEKLLKDLVDPKSLRDLKKMRAALAHLRGLRPVQVDLPAEVGELLACLDGWIREQERSRPLHFGRSLRDAAEAAGVGFAVLTTEPPEYRLEPFTLGVDFRKGVAELRYARLPLAETELDPPAILKTRQKMLQALETEDFEPEAFFGRLLGAYRRMLAGRPSGERVNLVDVLPEVAFLVQSQRFRRDPSRDHFQPYGRVRLAWDLARLRRSGGLHRNGMRLGLGTATMNTTRNKQDVLYLEDEGGRGQYYLTLWFAPEA